MLVIADPAARHRPRRRDGRRRTPRSAPAPRACCWRARTSSPASIRRTSRTLGLRTDAAYRFERGADIEGLLDANDRAAQLMAELAGGTVARGMLDAYPRRRKPVRVRLRMERVERVLGVAPPAATRGASSTGLGLPCASAARVLDVEVPSFRRDLAMEDDLAEEIIRVWGYDRIPSTLPGGADRRGRPRVGPAAAGGPAAARAGRCRPDGSGDLQLHGPSAQRCAGRPAEPPVGCSIR